MGWSVTAGAVVARAQRENEAFCLREQRRRKLRLRQSSFIIGVLSASQARIPADLNHGQKADSG